MSGLVRPVTQLELLLILAIIGAGFAWFVRIAWVGREQSWTFSRFFLGGRNIGPTLTEHSNWGLTFAWSNGLWFFAALAYQFGPRVILLQIPWCLSVALVAALLVPIMRSVGVGTIHGFLGARYGNAARVVACAATSIGYIFNCGFEMYWSARIFALSLGYERLVIPAAVAFASVCGAYCMIGGFLANCETDRQQTVMGMISLTVLCVLAGASIGGTAVQIATYGLAAICAAYVLMAIFLHRMHSRSGERLLTIVAVLSVPLLGLYVMSVQGVENHTVTATPHLFNSTTPPTPLIIGIVLFQLFFNPVDMANWQTVAANGDAPPATYPLIKWSLVRSASYMMWFPAIAGILVGCLARVHPNLGDNGIFPAVFGMVLPHSSELLRGVVFGLIFLGLISTSLSSSDTYIMAAAHTLSWDLILNRWFKEISATKDPERRRRLEADYVERVRRSVVPLSIGMMVVFAACYSLWPASVFAFQFIMYGSALSLFAPVVYGLWSDRRNVTPPRIIQRVTPWAIACGILAGLAPYIVVYLASKQDISGFSPLLSLAVSSLIFGSAILASRVFRPRVTHA